MTTDARRFPSVLLQEPRFQVSSFPSWMTFILLLSSTDHMPASSVPAREAALSHAYTCMLVRGGGSAMCAPGPRWPPPDPPGVGLVVTSDQSEAE